jgi:AbrB family looped-hinge helix DNA binding protein
MLTVATKEVTLSSKHQIVIPRESRKALGLKPGDKLLIVTLGEQVLVLRKPVRHADSTRGLARGLYPKGYVKAEHSAWG